MDTLETVRVINTMSLAGTFAGLCVLYVVSQLIYRTYYHPLHHIPGPWINSVSRIPFARHLLRGTTAENVMYLHRKYGTAVRLSPNEVSFISGETAWQDIYGFRTGKMKGQLNMQKDPGWYLHPPSGTQILLANDTDHSRYRRVLAHAFSAKALANQEVLLQQYVNLFVQSLKKLVSADEVQDMLFSFDIVADLTFGEPFGCPRDLSTHKYVSRISDSIQAGPLGYVMYYWPFVKHLCNLVINQATLRGKIELYTWIKDRTEQRINTETSRPDFMTEVLKHNGDKGAELTFTEMANNATFLIQAGSETTSSLLSGVTYLLLQNPEMLQKLKDDVRSRWQKYDEITLDEVNKAPYLIAVLQEALRYFPPTPTGLERRVGKRGAIVSGYYLPEGTGVSVSQLPLGHSELYFNELESFVPERWLGDPRFANDKKDILQPFNFGPRNCLGKNLAHAEMRLILAKLIWSFDFELDARSKNWMGECKVLTVWAKPPLWVRVRESEESVTRMEVTAGDMN